MGSIYIIKNKANDKVYIGQTIQDLNVRFLNHKMASRNEDTKFYRAIRKYGEDVFYIELLEEVPDELLDEREQYWIKEYDSYYHGYNSTLGGNGVPRIDYNLIKNKWDEGNSVGEISSLLKLYRDTISRVLKTKFNISEEDIKLRGNKTKRKLPEDFILLQWNNGLTPHQISKNYGGDTNTIKQVLKEHGFTEQDFKARADEHQRILTDDQVIKLWAQGLSINQINKIGGNRSTIRKILADNGITDEQIDQRRRETCNQNAKPVVQLTQDDLYIATYPSAFQAGKALNKPSTSISACCNHKPKYRTAYGFKWQFLEEYLKTRKEV